MKVIKTGAVSNSLNQSINQIAQFFIKLPSFAFIIKLKTDQADGIFFT